MKRQSDNHVTDNSAATAAYTVDGRGDAYREAVVSSGWHATFDRLLGQGYYFMGHTFMAGGVLFRGMPVGALQALRSASFWHSETDNPLCRLERTLDVIFCSEVGRDALAVAKPWQDETRDAAILVFNSDVFFQRWQQHAAAMLGFADVGMVFKYPCLAEPLKPDELYGVLLHPETLAQYQSSESWADERMPPYCTTPAADELDSRAGWTAALDRLLAREGVSAADSLVTSDYPRR